jgi:hypothetical protein
LERQRRYGSQACYKRSAIRKTSLNLPDAPLNFQNDEVFLKKSVFNIKSGG